MAEQKAPKTKKSSVKTEKKPTKTKKEVESNSMLDAAVEQNETPVANIETKVENDSTSKKKSEKRLIDIRIFTVPEREEMAQKNQEILGVPDDHVVIDKNHEGALPTARKAWSIKTDSPFVMVMNDDVELCNDFMKYCEKIITLHPDDVISLFSYKLRKRKSVRQRARRTPYVRTNEVMGQAVIMKKEYIEPCLAYWKDDFSDDVNISRWANDNKIPILTTLPTIIQHIGDDSVIDPERKIGRSDFYNPDPKDENWDDGYVNALSNVIAR